VAIDGSKFKAVNNRDRNFTRAKVERRRAQIEESVGRYLQQLDTADRQEPSEALAARTTRLKEKIARLEQEMQRLAELEAQMLASPDQQISLTDPDARSMATSGRGSGVVGYNVQVAVETKHHLIVAHEVTNDGCDRAQLSAMGKEAKAVLEVEDLEAVADRGYWDSEEILACDRAGITVTLPKPMTSSAKSDGRFGKQDFVYCPRRTSTAAQRREAQVLLQQRRAGADATALLDHGLPRLPAQEPLQPQLRSGGSRAGSMRMCWRRSSVGLTSTRGHAPAARRWSSTRSARSRCAWAPPTS
jgi:hypothetical protein